MISKKNLCNHRKLIQTAGKAVRVGPGFKRKDLQNIKPEHLQFAFRKYLYQIQVIPGMYTFGTGYSRSSDKGYLEHKKSALFMD